MISIAKTACKKIGVFFLSIEFLSPEVALYLYKSTMQLFDKLQKQIYRAVGPSIAASLEPLAHRRMPA